ncbi:arginyl-tRNA--protein transferase 1 isoform X2 [Agrilus planipennis]|uniref:Arginyl-tRNA--protein transferase 1 n=1 Tax=Agrilus planipennis TaxID=224129 RepID=A0A1W4XM78_AGRPL|nr:arginyl-tRNA--protein transferase 1 isoform X2 [Agrilus planipennis]
MASLSLDKVSIVYWHPDLERHRCGYCNNQNCSVLYGMWAEQLTVEDYQNLIDRGWRRSGKYCYKPVMHETCCPQYTIRCEALKFHPSKSQKKVIKRFNKFITDDSKQEKGDNISDNSSNTENSGENSSIGFISRQQPTNELDFSKFKDNTVQSADDCNIDESSDNRLDKAKVHINETKCDSEVAEEHKEVDSNIANTTATTTEVVKKGVGADPSRPPCKKAKLLRIERKQQKLIQKGLKIGQKETAKNEQKKLEDFIDQIPENAKHKLKLQIENISEVHPHFQTEAALFEKYQMAIHNDERNDCDPKQFQEFLVDTPLKTVRSRGENGTVMLGSFHQQYWIDDKLIAVGVIDILPKCVSSVYFFYDPEYRFLTLGTYGSLREIYFVRSLHQILPSIEYYYMGYYIHSCPKMRYKGRLGNSLLLCPETYKWFPIENCIPKLDANKYSRLNDDIDAIDEEMCSSSDIDRIKILIGYTFTIFGRYKRTFGEVDVYENIGRLVGKKCADKLLFVSSKER